ncbi:MAG TPA: glycosyltransferase [Candidatus Binatia bacterium]|nr:glycosyltransferase [Candidatus Binatia bacterium]
MVEHLSVVMPVYNERYLVQEAVRRVLAIRDPLISRVDLIIVDDGSTDGTRPLLRELAAQNPERITYIEHERNYGKGAAVRTGIARAQGSVTVIQDADLEYNPQDLARLMVPFVESGADAVYGSRFLTSDYRRVLYYRHRIGNWLLTICSNLLTDLDLTDMETCYKAIRTELLQSIPIRSNDFRLEVEMTFKLAKRGARIFEVPISYAGRTYEEGKKIGFTDAVLAVQSMIRWWLIDDMYRPRDPSEAADLFRVPKFSAWIADTVRPYVGGRVLEIGAGIGDLMRKIVPRDLYTASDVNPHHLQYLRNLAENKPYVTTRRIDLVSQEDFLGIAGQYDTVICLNQLQRAADDVQALRNIRTALQPEGRAILLVPQECGFTGEWDATSDTRRRYTRETLRETIAAAGLEVERMAEFDRMTVPALWFNARVLKRSHLSRVQLKAVDLLTGIFRRLDRVLPWRAASLLVVARSPQNRGVRGDDAPRSPSPARKRPGDPPAGEAGGATDGTTTPAAA